MSQTRDTQATARGGQAGKGLSTGRRVFTTSGYYSYCFLVFVPPCPPFFPVPLPPPLLAIFPASTWNSTKMAGEGHPEAGTEASACRVPGRPSYSAHGGHILEGQGHYRGRSKRSVGKENKANKAGSGAGGAGDEVESGQAVALLTVAAITNSAHHMPEEAGTVVVSSLQMGKLRPCPRSGGGKAQSMALRPSVDRVQGGGQGALIPVPPQGRC